MVDPVRPRSQQLPGARGRDLVGVVPGDDRLALVAERAQAGAELGDSGLVIPRGDLVLRAGQRESRFWHESNSGMSRWVRTDDSPGLAVALPEAAQKMPAGLLGERGTFSPAGS